MTKTGLVGATSIVGIFTVAACATSGGPSGGACDTGKIDLKGDHSCTYVCTPGPNAPNDPIDPDFTDENCDGTDGVVAKCLFVASDGADSANAGTRDAPMKTINYAIKAAKDRGMNVCVSGETYTGEIDLQSGVSVYGGYNEHDPDFAFRRAKNIDSTLTAKGTVVLAASIDAETHLEGFVINAGAPDLPSTGAGAYGVRLVGGLAALYVRYNNISTAAAQDGLLGKDAGDGQAGTNGADGTDGCSHCSVGSPNPPGGAAGGTAPMSMCGGASGGKGGQGGWDQSAGENGGSGTGANSGGGAGGGGNSTCLSSRGLDGQPGQSPTEAGAAGMDGVTAAAKGALDVDATYKPAGGGDGKGGAPGNAGGGGGGGGGGTNGTVACYGDKGAGGGSGGTGGCAGSPGTAATSGGASFAIVARAGKLVAGLNRMQAGKGGNGGAGGAGGAGGKGGKGGLGHPYVKANTDDGGGSAKGGDGSLGGSGGNGAGGAGGPSACIAVAPGVVLDETPTNQCTTFGGGTGGAGGNNATNKGPDGLSMPTLQL